MRKRSFAIALLLHLLPCAAAAGGVSLDPAKIEDMVLERSFGVKKAEIDRQVAAEGVPTAKGVFDTFLEGSASYQLNEEKQLNPIFGNRTDTFYWDVGLTKELAPTGTTLGVSLASDWTKTSGALAVGGNPILPPFGNWEPVLGFSLSQPLLYNAFGLVDRGGVDEARHLYASADQSVRMQVDTIVYEALQDYWDLFFVRRQLRAIERAIGFAREFLNTTLEERKLGTVEDTDVLAARANLLERQNEYHAYREYEKIAEEDLRNDLELLPHDDLVLAKGYPAKVKVVESVDAMISKALGNRGDYLAALEEIKRRRVMAKVARNKRLPQLNLVSTVDLNEIDRDYGRALGGMDSPNLTTGLTLSVPLENRAARAGARQAEAERARAVYEARDLETKIANQIARLSAAIGERLRIVEKTQTALNMHLEKQRLELAKYRIGRSNSDIVKRYQDDTVNTERRLFEAWLAYKKALLDLRLALGTMVSETGEVEERTEVIRR